MPTPDELEIEADYYRFMLLFVHVFSTWPPTCVFVFVQSVQWQESLQFVMNSKIWVKSPSHDYLEDRREEKDPEIIEVRLLPTSSCDYVILCVPNFGTPNSHYFSIYSYRVIIFERNLSSPETFIILYPFLPSAGTAFSGRHPGSWLIARIQKWGVLKHGGSP